MLYWLYGFFAFIATLNLILMRRPMSGGDAKIVALIPARNEAENLRALVPLLIQQGLPVIVFDDESQDGTAEAAASAGATVIRASEPLPDGWTGKNRACHELAIAATEATDADWLLFLDADVTPQPTFGDAIRAECQRSWNRVGVITGIPRIVSGQGVEPLFMAWIGWIILATNPFGLVSRSKMGHNHFLNGQIQAWDRRVYVDMRPHEQVRSRIMEDVQMGRLLARRGTRVETLALAPILSVRMYKTWRECLDGFSKNVFEITGSYWGTFIIATLLAVLAGLWVLEPWSLLLLIWSAIAVAITARSAWWPAVLMPIALLIGSFTLLRSMAWRRSKSVRWKGRVYGG